MRKRRPLSLRGGIRYPMGLWSALLLLVLITACQSAVQQTSRATLQGEAEGKPIVTVYTARHYAIDGELFEAFTQQTGIAVREVKGTAEELVARLLEEGDSTSADLFMTADGTVLQHAKEQGVLQSFESARIADQVPVQWRDPDGHWTAVTTRARVLVYARDRVDPEELSTYEQLADPVWKGRILVRSSSNLYNQTLLAYMIELYGEAAASAWVSGIADNMARIPEGGDRAQAKGVAAGIGDVAIMNAYYIGQLAASADSEDVRAAEQLGVFFPNQDTGGTHVNISGIGLVKHAPNPEQAVKLVEYLTALDAQNKLTANSFEYPVHPDAKLPPLLESWGDFRKMKASFADLYRHHDKLHDIFQKAGWQ